MKQSFIFTILFQSCSLALIAQEAPDQFPGPKAREENYTMKVTARLIDEEGNPMPNEPIQISIHNVNDYKDEYNDVKGVTDAEGKFSAEGIGRGIADVKFIKIGYYPSVKTVTCNDGTAEQIRKSGKFLPWNPVVDVMAKKVGKPIPMLVRLGGGDSKTTIKPTAEQLEKDVGWDLIIGDWVAPQGKGKTSDLVFNFQSQFINDSDFSSQAKISMGNPDDGFIVIEKLVGAESLLKFPRSAPENGYTTPALDYYVGIKDEDYITIPKIMPAGYLFRIRTVKDKSGKITSAIYGKFTAPFILYDPTWRENLPTMKFDCYINPNPNDQNLEYDQKNNLAPEVDKGLTWPPG